MQIGVLGPLVVQVAGTSVVPTAAKPRQMLALLAANAGHEVGMAALVEELWDDRPPSGPAQVVQTYVKQLRRALARAAGVPHSAPEPKELLRRGHTGYTLDMPGAAVEADEFTRLAETGLRAAAQGDDPEAAARLLRRALRLWRGPAFADVRTGPVLRAQALRLDEERQAVLEARMTADLRLGRHAEILGELSALAERFPFQENLHALLMVALYRNGRSWQALEAFRRLRSTCARELGIEPSARLQRLHQAILSSDPRLDTDLADLDAGLVAL
ncbi:AfsR/SARP family transcriptional regulator [Streptomyces sp. XM83C]|jgi:DNA-binding SARP family transcriptional activator|uniref:BTAD domain-containing putative transcriptional regulator n=1 Tax=Streptomyces thermocoprophilus TaxID=78356 RepID=A0ABV5V952_9ACTN|nr:AfsR/SARP family transcriptional regulator [Streptomyces sp. XM83C]MCK1821790.1 AfsR/SARP family transcriptional regulator [Streptomyces sp. XM83C]